VSYIGETFTRVALEHLELRRLGTVVRVEGLWDDMPVRVEAREGAEEDKDSDDMNRGILMVLPSRGDLRVVAKDENSEVKIKVRALWDPGGKSRCLNK